MDWFSFTSLRPLRKPAGIALLALLAGLVSSAHAQYEIKSGVYNQLSGRVPSSNTNGIPPVGANLAPTGLTTTSPQYANIVESTTASVGSLSSGTFTYPNSLLYTRTVPVGGVMLWKSSVGTTFASGVPRYFLGDVISPPTTVFSTSGQASTKDASFWRAKPLAPGEVIYNNDGSTPTNYRDGASVLTGALASGLYTPYHYSSNAKLVFANTPGLVTLTWVSALQVDNKYVCYTETFPVSSATSIPVRNMYWTERSYSAPAVAIPSGQIQRALPVYSNTFPATVSSEIEVPGSASTTVTGGIPELRTMWYDNLGGSGRLHAYNVTGRLLLEYLGAEKDDGTYEFLGIDIVNVETSPASSVQDVVLGTRIRAFDGANTDYDDSLVAEVSASGGASSNVSYYGRVAQGDGSTAYYAERINDVPEKVAFYWMKPLSIGIKVADLGISSSTVAAKTLINWPKYLNLYTQSWPVSVTDYVHYTVADKGSSLTSGTGLRFAGGGVPTLVYQDSTSGGSKIQARDQQLIVDLASESDLANKTLLKFSGSNGSVWYVRLLTQDMDGASFLEGDASAATSGIAYVGERLSPPSSEYTDAAYIVSGKSYLPSAYINPFTSGIPAAERGAVIPVNALPEDQTLTVWWFKKVAAISSEFQDFYTPAKVARYTVAYRETAAPVTYSFEESAVSGWTVNTATALTPPSASGLSSTQVLGPFGTYFVDGIANSTASAPATAKTFYPGSIGAGSVTLTFLLYRLDTWSNKTFSAYVKTAADTTYTSVFSGSLSSSAQVTATTTGTLSVGGVTYSTTMAPVAGSFSDFATFGASGVSDQIFRVSIVATPTTQAGSDSLAVFTLGVGSNLSSSTGGFAIDDVTLTLPLPTIVLAANEGSGILPVDVAQGSIYNQPVRTLTGYNPNEEHALLLNGRAYALRDDLNIESGPLYTSKRRVLVQYTDALDKRPSVSVFKVAREDALHTFEYEVTAGTVVNVLAPMPLPLLSLPLEKKGDKKEDEEGECPNIEIDLGSAYHDVDPATGAPSIYSKFTFKDRKGYDWVYRGPHNPSVNASPAFGMRFYYVMRSDFYFPSLGTQPLVGTVLPYLPVTPDGSAAAVATDGTPKDIVYKPVWPSYPPTMSVGESLTLSKSGLPGVRGQTSAELLYHQSIAQSGTTAVSGTLVDPTRAKTVLINATNVDLQTLPASLKTTVDSGKTYFQLAPPHLQKRFYYSPLLGAKGGLVLEGD